MLSSLCHLHTILLELRHIIVSKHRSNSLRNGAGLQHADISVGEIDRLLCSHNDILIVRQNKYSLCRGCMNRTKNIIRRRIHRLTAAYHLIDTKIQKGSLQTGSCCHSNKANLLVRFHRYKFLLTNNCRFLHLILMLDLHVFDFRLGIIDKAAEFQCFSNRQTGIIRMHMNFDDLIVIHYHNTITDRFQIGTQLCGICSRIMLLYNILGTISEVDFLIILRNSRIEIYLRIHRAGTFCGFFGQSTTTERFQHTFHDNAKALTTGIHNICFFQGGQHFGCLLENIICFLTDFLPEIQQFDIGFGKLLCFGGCHSGYGQNSTFRGLHNRFIGTCHTKLQSIGEVSYTSLLQAGKSL